MFDQEILKKTRIQPVDIPEGILRRVTRGNPQAKCRVPNGKSEVDEQGSLVGILGQSDGNIAGDRRSPGPSFGADKDEQPSQSLLCWKSFLAKGGRNPNESLSHSAFLEGRRRYSRAPARIERIASF